jgi:uncharacterized membrane protein YdfJ with MMPL/SSD domain
MKLGEKRFWFRAVVFAAIYIAAVVLVGLSGEESAPADTKEEAKGEKV